MGFGLGLGLGLAWPLTFGAVPSAAKAESCILEAGVLEGCVWCTSWQVKVRVRVWVRRGLGLGLVR